MPVLPIGSSWIAMTRAGMTSALLGLASALSPCAAQEKVGTGPAPVLDIRRTCESAAQADLDLASGPTLQQCLDEEASARRAVDAAWPKASAEDRRLCAAATQVGGFPSYVEMLGCLQDASAAREAGKRS